METDAIQFGIVWESIFTTHAEYLSRAKVHGGWLVKSVSDVRTLVPDGYGGYTTTDGYEWRTALTFIPDPDHEWTPTRQETLNKKS